MLAITATLPLFLCVVASLNDDPWRDILVRDHLRLDALPATDQLAPLDCASIPRLPLSPVFARGALKKLQWANVSHYQVAVATPHEKALKKIAMGVRHAMSPERRMEKARRRYWELWQEDQALLATLSGRFTPQLFGSCVRSLDEMALVVEPLRGFVDVILDETITLPQRLLIALSSVDLLAFWQAVPGGNAQSGVRQCVYGDFHAQQFGVSREYRVKQLDVDAKDFHCYAPGARLGGTQACQSSRDCFEHFSGERDMLGRLWSTTLGGLGQSQRAPSELDCDALTHRCVGLDGAINVYALCRTMLQHLLVSVPAASERLSAGHGAASFVAAAQSVLADCARHDAAKRSSPAALRVALARLAVHVAPSVLAGGMLPERFVPALRTLVPPLALEPSDDANRLKRRFLRIELPPRANVTELAQQVDMLVAAVCGARQRTALTHRRQKRQNGLLRARIRQLERATHCTETDRRTTQQALNRFTTKYL